MYLGGIEAGGTKFVCAVSDVNLNIIEQISIPTTKPEETITKVYNFFGKFELKSIGIGSFGPIDVNEKSKTYGYITNTPKEGWKFYDFVGNIKQKYSIPVYWTTDVNAAAYGEAMLGAAKNYTSSIYLTIGTGIGGGVILNNKILEGFNHPEMGHIFIRKHPKDTFKGSCPYHNDCLEGLACGKAIEDRWAMKAYELGMDHEFWKIEAYYIAQAIANYTYFFSPEKIILGGGVMKQEQLLPLIKDELISLLNGYIEIPPIDEYITTPELQDNSGIIGCLLLANDINELN